MPQSLLVRIAKKLDEAKVPYMLIGGQAVIFYGEPRFTQDIDLTLGFTPDRIDELIRLAAEIGLTSEVKSPADFAKQTMVFPTVSASDGLRVDFIFSNTGFEQDALARTRRVEMDGYPIRIVALDDLIVLKTLAGRPRDLDDLKVLLLKNPNVIKEPEILATLRSFSEIFEVDLQERFLEIRKKLHP